MKLLSDFRDYYDYAFDGRGEEFLRYAANFGPSKVEQFRILEAANYYVPKRGLLGDLLERADRNDRFVVYDDVNAHRGDGKRLVATWQLRSNPHMGMPGGDRFFHEKQKFASEFLGDTAKPPISHRWLHVGSRHFYLRYTSSHPWQSNVGDDADCQLIDEYLPEQKRPMMFPELPYALYAVDYVTGKDGREYAVDLNVSPGIRGTGVEDLLKPYDAVKEIEQWFVTHSRGTTGPSCTPPTTSPGSSS